MRKSLMILSDWVFWQFTGEVTQKWCKAAQLQSDWQWFLWLRAHKEELIDA